MDEIILSGNPVMYVPKHKVGIYQFEWNDSVKIIGCTEEQLIYLAKGGEYGSSEYDNLDDSSGGR